MTPAHDDTLNRAVLALARTTGLNARVHTNGRAGQVLVELEAAGRTQRFEAVVKPVDRFAIPAMVKEQSTTLRETPLLVAPYVTTDIAERCRQLHLPFIDTAGNAWLEGPGLLIYVAGQPRPGALRRDRFRALNPAGLRIAFALLCRPELTHTNYRDIAANAGVALGTIGPVMKDLEARGYLRFHENADRKLIDPDHLIEEWVTHYPVTLRPKLNPRRFRGDLELIDRIDLALHDALWGGEKAAEKLTGYLKPAQFTIYTRAPIVKLIAAGHMRADDNGNVEILDRFWNFKTDQAFPDVVPPLLAYADLLATHEGRNIEAARMIYEQRIAPAYASTR